MSPDILGEALGAVSLSLLIVYVVIKEVVVKRNNEKKLDHPFYCQAGKYESRITSLESRCSSNDDNIHRLEAKIDRNSEKIDQAVHATNEIRTDVRLIAETVRWIKADRTANGR